MPPDQGGGEAQSGQDCLGRFSLSPRRNKTCKEPVSRKDHLAACTLGLREPAASTRKRL